MTLIPIVAYANRFSLTTGETIEFKALCRIDTDIENEYYKHRGLLPYVLRKMISD